jgi:hypothetical protein
VDQRFLKRGPSAAVLVALALAIALVSLGVGAALAAAAFVAWATPAADERPADLVGLWTVSYTNGATRVYIVDRAGNVTFADGRPVGVLSKQADGTLLLSLEGDKLERITLGTDGRLFVEHYAPRAGFPGIPPTCVGIGVR